jgi:hypothetical protein
MKIFKKHQFGRANARFRTRCKSRTLLGNLYVKKAEIGNVGKIPFLWTIVKCLFISSIYSSMGLSPICLSILDVLKSLPVSKNDKRDAKCAKFGMVANNVPSGFNIL